MCTVVLVCVLLCVGHLCVCVATCVCCWLGRVCVVLVAVVMLFVSGCAVRVCVVFGRFRCAAVLCLRSVFVLCCCVLLHLG